MRTCGVCQKPAPDEAGFCPSCGQRFPVAPAGGGMSTKMAVILVAVISLPLLLVCAGILAAIALPNFLDATVRARQKRAVSEVRSLAVAVQAYQIDHDRLPETAGVVPGGGWQEVPARDLAPLLVPDYIAEIPAADPWEEPYRFAVEPDAQSFYLLSLGQNRSRERRELPEAPRMTRCYESDILWLDTEFRQAPDGKQRSCGDDVAARELGGE